MTRKHVSKPSGTGPRHALPYPAPRWGILSVAAALVGVLLFAGTAFGLVYRDLQGALRSNTQVNKLLDRAPKDSYDGRALNVLVLGTDTRHGEGNDVDDNDDPTQRADTAMIVHLSADRTRAQVVSVPRDTLVQIPSCARTNGTHSKAQRAQFNWAYSIGGEDGSPSSAIACTLATVEKFSGLYIDDFILVDFNGFHKMVDALGGVDVYVDHKISDPDHSELELQPGCIHMNGDTALKYSRVRHGVKGGDGSDIQRIGRQQHMMSIMFRTAKQKNILTNLPSLYQFGRAGLSALTTSEGLGSLSTMAGLAYSMRNIDPANIIFITVPVSQARVDKNRVEFNSNVGEIWEALKHDRPLPGGLEATNANAEHLVTPDPAAAAGGGNAAKGAGDESEGAQPGAANDKQDAGHGGDDAGKPGKNTKTGKAGKAGPADDQQNPEAARKQAEIEAARAKCEPK